MCKEKRKYVTAIYNRHMQDMRSHSYKQNVLTYKHIYANKFIMITFPEKLSKDVSNCMAKKHM